MVMMWAAGRGQRGATREGDPSEALGSERRQQEGGGWWWASAISLDLKLSHLYSGGTGLDGL